MPDDRMLHSKMGHSEKIEALDNLAFRVWATYLIAADDCGIVRHSATSFQEANAFLDKQPRADIERAIQDIVSVGLLDTFQHQHRTFLFQRDWQDWQHIRYPRASIHPEPPADVVSRCSESQQKLLCVRYKKSIEEFLSVSMAAEKVPEKAQKSGDSALSGETSPVPAGAGVRERLAANGLRQEANGKGSDAPVEFRRMPPAGRSDGVFAGALPRDTLNNVFTSEESSVCVPYAVHGKLINALAPKFSGDRQRTGDALKAWYPEVSAGVPADFVMGDAFKFWQIHFDSKWASKPATGPKFLPPEEALAEMHRQDALRARKPRPADAR